MRAGCYGQFQFQIFMTQNGHVFHILHAAKVCINGIPPGKNQNTKYWYFLLYPL
jgi:hypothetical protein